MGHCGYGRLIAAEDTAAQYRYGLEIDGPWLGTFTVSDLDGRFHVEIDEPAPYRNTAGLVAVRAYRRYREVGAWPPVWGFQS